MMERASDAEALSSTASEMTMSLDGASKYPSRPPSGEGEMMSALNSGAYMIPFEMRVRSQLRPSSVSSDSALSSLRLLAVMIRSIQRSFR